MSEKKIHQFWFLVLGFNGACSVHEWSGTFQSQAVNFKFTSVCGHINGLDFVGKFNSWDRCDPSELFGAPTEKKESTPKLKMPAFLASEARGCDYLVLWLDCDKEGENICFEVMDAVSSSMRNVRSPLVTFRAKFSAITDKDIKHAMNNLIQPNENEALSVDARQEVTLGIAILGFAHNTAFLYSLTFVLDALSPGSKRSSFKDGTETWIHP